MHLHVYILYMKTCIADLYIYNLARKQMGNCDTVFTAYLHCGGESIHRHARYFPKRKNVVSYNVYFR